VVVGATVVVVVLVVVVGATVVVVVLTGVVCACAGTMTERSTGVFHDFGNIKAEAAVPTVTPATTILLRSES
jgi:hypothetical protein